MEGVGNQIMMGHKIGTKSDRIENLKNEGYHLRTSLPCPSMGVPSQGGMSQGDLLIPDVFVLDTEWKHMFSSNKPNILLERLAIN